MMKKDKRLTLLAFAVFAAVAASALGGCKRLPPRPEGMPELYPCTMHVTFGGEIVEGVRVGLISDDPALKKWRAGGVTDAEGNVVIKTAAYYDGAAAGTFKLSFSKSEDRLGDTLEEMQPLSLIPLKYLPVNTKLTVEIKPEKNEFVYELDGGQEVFLVPKGSVQPPKHKR